MNDKRMPVSLRMTEPTKDGLAGLISTELEDLQDGRSDWGEFAGPSDGRGREDDAGVWYEGLRDLYHQLTGTEWQNPFDEPEGLLQDGR